MRRRYTQTVVLSGALLLSTGCGVTPAVDAAVPVSPPPSTDAPACVLSADCPAGTHCDLGECVQACNTIDPCDGTLTCTPRGRCAPEGVKDAEPIPTGQFEGKLEVSPRTVELSERDKSFAIELRSTSAKPVRYRIQLAAPHLHVDETRGELTGSKTLTVKVDAYGLKGRDVSGEVKIFTDLGNSVVLAPIHVGLTGSYSGAMRYDGGPVYLGDARIALDVLEENGSVKARVDARSSLLFPASDSGETTGRGVYTASDGLDLTLSQVVAPTFGEGRNRFQRPIGRKVRIKAMATATGILEGRFEETVHGLFAAPVTTRGTVRLEFRRRGDDPRFTLAEEPIMPASPSKDAFFAVENVFGWKPAAGPDRPLPGAIVSTCQAMLGCISCNTSHTDEAERQFAVPLVQTWSARSGTQPIQSIADACRASSRVTSMAEYTGAATSCGLVPPLACALDVLGRKPANDVAVGRRFVRIVGETLAPAMLLAKNEIVRGLADSFVVGPAAERDRYEEAQRLLGPPATWVLQPAVLEFLRSMPPDSAKGEEPGGDLSTLRESYPAARALADLFVTSTTLDGERARASAAFASGSQADMAADTQRRALLAHLEAVALTEMLSAWRSAPKTVSVRFTGALTPLDQGFGALLDGANAFGVPQGFVPFVFRPEDMGRAPTNFEQMLVMAADSIALEKTVEEQFQANRRQYDLNTKDLQQQLASVRAQFDLRIKDICGAAFNPDAVNAPSDWSQCSGGEAAALRKEVEITLARASAGQSRLTGAITKLEIDTGALAAVSQVRQETLVFLGQNGNDINAVMIAQAVHASVVKGMEIAAQSSLLNFGAPSAMAIPAALAELQKGMLEAERTHLQHAQTMRFEQSNARVELIKGMAELQKQAIDITQLGVEIQQDCLAVTLARLRALNAVAQARAIHEERGRVLGVLGRDPSNDPSYRLLRDQLALSVIKARTDAQRTLFLATSALQYELNTSLSSAEGAVLSAHNATNLQTLTACLQNIHNGARVAYGVPQEYVTTISVRKMLGIARPRKDDVTGEVLSEGEQFRHLLLRNENLDGRGGVGVVFATNLQPGNELFATDVCNDRLASVQAELVGDFLGDNRAQINLSLSGASVLRACDSAQLRPWSIAAGTSAGSSAFAVIQAGVNSFGDAAPNTSLFGQSVARASWSLVIPGGKDAPSNGDLDLTKVDDVVLKFAHKALARRTSPLSVDVSCLATVGK